MEIIVISVAQYKEKDAVVNAITEGKSFSFYARGILNPKNKNSFLNNTLCKANITLLEGKLKYPILETAELINTPQIMDCSLDYLNALLTIDDAVLNLFEQEEKFLCYEEVNKALTALRKGKNAFYTMLYFLLHILPSLGFELEVKSCVGCGSTKNITDFSFVEGGFLCNKCLENSERKYTNSQLILLRNAILSKEIDDIKDVSINDIKALLFDINVFLSDGIGYHLRTLDTLLK